MVGRKTHNNQASCDSSFPSVKIEERSGTKKTNVAVRHVICYGRNVDWMSLSCWKLPHNHSNPEHRVSARDVFDAHTIQGKVVNETRVERVKPIKAPVSQTSKVFVTLCEVPELVDDW